MWLTTFQKVKLAALAARACYADVELHFREEEVDAIVQAVAYHCKDHDYSAIWFPPREHLDVRPTIATPFHRESTTGLGSLDRLPFDVLHDVFLLLDMQSLFKFRQTNLRSRQSIDALKQYQMAASHGLNTMCALLRTRLATSVSLFDFYKALCTKACAFCGDFGVFISLFVWQRCCYTCLLWAPMVQVRDLDAMRRKYGLIETCLDQLRSFETLPGKYSMRELGYTRSVTVTSPREAKSFRRNTPHAVTEPDRHDRRRRLPNHFNFMGSCVLPYYDKRTGRVDHGMSCAGCLLVFKDDQIGRLRKRRPFEGRDKVYAQDDFLRHFQVCEQAQLLWKLCDEGRKRPAELPEAACRGGFLDDRE